MSLVLKIGFTAVLIFSFFFASWYVLHGDITFSADIGRDFHLLRELDQKKIMLIGPRASGNLFHGPGWPYMNYPFYVLGHGNPIAVGWGWVFFTILFSISCFYVASKLFGKTTGYLFCVFATLYMAFHARGMINPHGAMLFVPIFFYLFARYIETKKLKYLILHLIITMIMVQIELAIGTPLLLLSIIAVSYIQIKRKNLKPLLSFLIIPLLLVNFLLFDLKHSFLITHKVIEFITPKAGGHGFNYVAAFKDRVALMLSGVEILRRDIFKLNYFLFIATLILALIQIHDKNRPLIYKSLLYFYVGYFVLSFIDKGPLLYFYQFPMFLFVFLIFASLYTSRYKRIFVVVFALVLLLNIRTAFLDMSESKSVIGKDVWSWKFLDNLSATLFNSPEKEFGYFVYSPDALAYEPKYALIYEAAKSQKNVHYFRKEKITYVVAAPPPQNNPYMKSVWWVKNQVKVGPKPVSVIKFENGYEIQKYVLSQNQVSVPFDPSIDPGLTFR